MKAKRAILYAVAAMLILGISIAYAAGPTGAIFTTTPDGSIVNENVRYDDKRDVYLDGGPPPNAPATAAGLDDGYYVFQVTDPSGKFLLSQDPAKCRIVRVSGGVIVERVKPSALNMGLSDSYNSLPCHIDDNLPHPTNPGVRGASGRHDTNADVDHYSDAGAIVVQLMPYGTTPNPGGVYKAWITPLAKYLEKGGKLDFVPKQLPIGQQKPHRCPDFCAAADPGFKHPDIKTDNFKVKEFFPPEIKVRKFHDLDGDGIWDAGEPEIGVGYLLDGGGWPYDFTEPLDSGTVTNLFYTPHTHVAGIPGTYTACEKRLEGWTQTAAYLDSVLKNADQCVSVTVAGISGEKHEIIFGNFKNVEVEACKFEDKTGDGLSGDDTPLAGWTVHLTKSGVVQKTQTTGTNGCYKWTNLGPVPGGYYDVSEDVPAGWTPTSATSHNFESPPISGSSYSFTFTNFKNVKVKACKFEDMTGNGLSWDDKPIAGWTVRLTKSGAVQDTQQTGADGCYEWTDLGPVPGGYYDVSEAVPAGWTPTSPTSHNFESPPISGSSYSFTFTNFKNIEVEACKQGDMDGHLETADDRFPIAGWTVHLTKNGVVQDTKATGANGCYKWTNLGPVPGGYYDVSEDVPFGWLALTPTFFAFESPPKSGASYSFTFVNTPTQGCTPGFWKTHSRYGPATGDYWPPTGYDPDDLVSSVFGSAASSPYEHLGSSTLLQALEFQGGDSLAEKAEILLRAAVAAVLNAAHPDVIYPFPVAYIVSQVNDALDSHDESTILALAGLLDRANNLGCPIGGPTP